MVDRGDARGGDSIVVTFLTEGEQTGPDVAARLAAFIRGARVSLDLALFDCRLSPPLAAVVAGALRERAEAGVAIRIAYDADKPEPPLLATGMDPAPAGTGRFIQSLGHPWRRIGGPKLMHHKYLARDAGAPTGAVWTGSTNMTDDAWTFQENTIVELASPELAGDFARDFAELWATETIGESGAFDTRPVQLRYAGQPVTARALFAPGRGPEIDDEVARRVAAARRRVRVCSMLLNSGDLLTALLDVLRAGEVEVSGVYDRTQMAGVLDQWRTVPHNRWKIGAVREVVARARLTGKDSTPYRPDSRHDFMHNKTLVVDDTVITGSYNFSRSAESNAENLLLLESAALADHYSRYIDDLLAKYPPSAPL